MNRSVLLFGAVPTLLLFVVVLAGEACESRRRVELARCLKEHPGLPFALCVDASNRWWSGGMR